VLVAGGAALPDLRHLVTSLRAAYRAKSLVGGRRIAEKLRDSCHEALLRFRMDFSSSCHMAAEPSAKKCWGTAGYAKGTYPGPFGSKRLDKGRGRMPASRAVALTQALQASRERLVATREEERRPAAP
jgi:hypothetical protein